MKRKTIIIPLLALGVFSVAGTIHAEDVVLPAAPQTPSVESVSEKAPGSFGASLGKIVARGTKIVNERIAALGGLKTKIAASKLTDAQKQTLSSSIDTEVASLNTVLSNISAASSTANAKALVNSVYTDYRVYAVFMPQIRLTMNANTLENHLAKLNSDTFAKVQARLDAAKAKGKDVTAGQANLDNAKTLAATLGQKITDLETSISGMKPADYPVVSKSTIKAANASIKSIRGSFTKINSLLKQAK